MHLTRILFFSECPLNRNFDKMEQSGKWKMENGKWKMENGKWKMENGICGMEFMETKFLYIYTFSLYVGWMQSRFG